MLASTYLSEIEKLERAVKNKYAELADLRCLAESITAHIGTEPVQTSGVSDRVGGVTVRIVMKQDEILRMIDNFLDEKQKRIEIIELLEKPLEYDVLYQKYVKYMTLAEIAKEEKYSYQHICDIHNKALEKIQIIINTL